MMSLEDCATYLLCVLMICLAACAVAGTIIVWRLVLT